MFQRVGAAAYRTDLHNIRALCNLLGNPQQHLRCVHVAGTNGKGSVTHFIASALQHNGYKVGVFVSPHYKDYRERIKINGQYISKQFVTRFIAQYKHAFSAIDASFFEITTAMAFAYFKQKKVDFAIIETGMGGRLDSTNIIQPILSVITNIGYDHMQFLGNTLHAIAGEKAGIIKPLTPVVIGKRQKETSNVYKQIAKSLQAPLYFAETLVPEVRVPKTIIGSYQRENVRTAWAALQVLKQSGIQLSNQVAYQGIARVHVNTRFMGRCMVIQNKPMVIWDSAHNVDGMRALWSSVSLNRYKKVHVVYGTVSDKDILPILKKLPPKAQFYFCKADIPRGMPVFELQQKAEGAGLEGNVYTSVKKAYQKAMQAAGKNDLVVVTGSVFVVAELL